MIKSKSGSSKRKLSCPLSVSISVKLTFLDKEFKIFAIALFSDVGNNQSEVKDIIKCLI